jgi:hypothetical protein
MGVAHAMYGVTVSLQVSVFCVRRKTKKLEKAVVDYWEIGIYDCISMGCTDCSAQPSSWHHSYESYENFRSHQPNSNAAIQNCALL